jgi:protein KRI1
MAQIISGYSFHTRQVGDLPTRFKYTTVPPTTFALDPAEILMATDKELNEYMSVKRLAPYKNKNRGTWDKDRNKKLLELKQAIASRTWDGVPVSKWVQGEHEGRQGGARGTHEGDGAKKKKRMGKKERSKLKALAEASQPEAAVDVDNGDSNQVEGGDISESERPRKKRKKNKVTA